MDNEMKITNVYGFKEFLIKNGYSKHVIPMYIRKVTEFLEREVAYSSLQINHTELKKIIDEYMATIPLKSQKGMIQAALHTYYYFISGKQFIKRLKAKDYDLDLSIELEVERFSKYLIEVARLSDDTITSRCNTLRTFLYSSFPDNDFSPKKVNISHIRDYLIHSLSHVSAASKKSIIVRIRSYIKFLEFTDGVIIEEILKLPMTSPVWKHAVLPKYLTDSELSKLLSTYNRMKPSGARDYAIARCLKDLGLRCSEVAELSLDDFDWIQGTVTIRKSKSHSQRTLPLHATTGQAIEDYILNWRPIASERILFVRYKNHHGQLMGTSQIRNTVRYAAMKAGLDNFTGTHMLRHTAAKEMINNGIDLKTMADILGHESIETTCIYTKLDFTQLQDVTGTWPEVRA